MTDSERISSRRHRAPVRAIGGVAVTVVAVSAGVAAAIGFGGDSTDATTAQRPPATATITQQTLVDNKTVDAELGYGPSRSVSNRLPGTVTWLPDVSAVIAQGQTLFRVDNRPVVLMFGAVPAYRDLSSGVEGPDVKQVEENLAALGYTGFTVDESYTASTADAVRQWQRDLAVADSGRIALGHIVFGLGEVRIDSLKTAVGEPAPSGQAVLTYTGTDRVVTVELDVADQRLAKKGTSVTVVLPDGNRLQGTIDQTSTVIETPENPNAAPETKIVAIISLADPAAGADLQQASVDVILKASERKDVLTVPVAALVALAEGGYGVEIIEGASSRYVAVETGLFSGGRVEIRGEGLAEGMAVGMPA